MTRRCPPEDALAGFSEEPSGYPEVAQHIRECSRCMAVVAILQRAESLPGGFDLDEYLAELDALLDELRAAPRHRWPVVIMDPKFQRLDFARRLVMAGIGARWQEPGLAIDLTKAAAKITDSLQSEAPELAETRFEAWKIYSALLRESGRYNDCREALEHAAQAALSVDDAEMADASILLARALLAIERDIWEPDEASAYLDAVEPIFERRDRERWLRARTVRGTLFYRLGDRRCVDVWTQVFVHTAADDTAARHDALSNLLHGRVDCGDAAADIDEQLSAVEAEDRRRNAPALLARDRWLRGKLDALRQLHREALDELHAAMAEYRDLENDDAAVRVGIDAVASLIALEEYAAAIDMCRTLVEWSMALDRAEPSRRRALTAEATAYLHELARRYSLTHDVVLEVRRYVFRITHQRPVPFIPPLSLQTV